MKSLFWSMVEEHTERARSHARLRERCIYVDTMPDGPERDAARAELIREGLLPDPNAPPTCSECGRPL